jgi:hypothetical protein
MCRIDKPKDCLIKGIVTFERTQSPFVQQRNRYGFGHLLYILMHDHVMQRVYAIAGSTANYDRSQTDEHLEQQNETINNETSAFRFAGLFFKKTSMSAAKPSNLKRAKSGIQLERKKLFSNNASSIKTKQHAHTALDAKPRYILIILNHLTRSYSAK